MATEDDAVPAPQDATHEDAEAAEPAEVDPEALHSALIDEIRTSARRSSLNRVSTRDRHDSSGSDRLSYLKEAINKEITSPPKLKHTDSSLESRASVARSSFSLRHQMPEPLLRSLSKTQVQSKVDAASRQAQEKERIELVAQRAPPRAAAAAEPPKPPEPPKPKGFLGGLVRKVSGSILGGRPKSASKEGGGASEAEEDEEERRGPLDMEVWVADAEQVWITARVESQVGRAQLVVRTAEGACVKVDMGEGGEVPTVNPTYEADMTSLWYLHEPGVLDNLRGRLRLDEPYTYVAHLLIAVNPMKRLPNPEMDTLKKAQSLTSIAPHPYALAESAYRNLSLPKDVRQSQSLVVSGESGAGKTESAKMLMRYICWRAAPRGSKAAAATLNERIVQSNPILESLGNAKTQRNHNSSRFGKYIRIVFKEENGAHVAHSANIDTYLLEKSRLALQAKGERNFHIFYEMLSGATDAQRKQWGISSAEECHYLNQSGVMAVKEHDDVAEFSELTKALGTMSMDAEVQGQMLSLIAGLLHLGNVTFDELEDDASSPPSSSKMPRASPLGAIGEGDAGVVESPTGLGVKVVLEPPSVAALEQAAAQLGLEPPALHEALTTRKMTTIAHGAAESVSVPLDAQKCTYMRDGLAKAVFNAVFDWAVRFINEQLGSTAEPSAELFFIGILDIFGFESFAVNSLEQLLINFANEKLQATFNSHVFTTEQELYKAEGISWRAITWPDNSGAISLISQKGSGMQPGLLHLLDEVCRLPRTTDLELNKRFHDVHAGNPHFPRPGIREVQTKFKILHYAGEVSYTVDGFLDKNNDTVSNDVQELCCNSSNALLSSIFKRHAELLMLKELEVQKAASQRQAARQSLTGGPAGGVNSSKRPSVATAPQSDVRGGTKRGSVQALAMQATEAMETASTGRAPMKRGSVAQKSFASVGLNFMRQMTALVNELDTTRCNFIRCIKPNYQLSPGVFDAHYTVMQLRHTGMLQTCALLKNGYPTRIGYAEVKQRYLPVLPKQIASLNLSDAVFAGAILYGFEVPRSLYQLGATRVFFRSGGVSALDDMRYCDMSKRAPRLIKLVKRYIILRNYRRGLTHVRMGNALLWQLRRVRAINAWLFAARVLRIYARGFRKMFRKVAAERMATVIQARARAMAPRRKLLQHTQAERAAREAARLAEIAAKEAAAKAKAAAQIEALARGSAQRKAYREKLRKEAEARRAELEAHMAGRIQGLARGASARKLYAALREQDRIARRAALEARMGTRLCAASRGMKARRERRVLAAAAEAERRRIELEVYTPLVIKLQRWWRIVRSEGVARRFRGVVERFTAPHRRLIAEMVAMRKCYDGSQANTDELTEDQKFLRADFQNRAAANKRAPAPPPPTKMAVRKFEMWISLKVGLGEPEEGAETTAFSGYQVFSARSAILKKAGKYFKEFFTNTDNVDENRDADGHYLVPRSWKHFDAILDHIRDGSLVLPKAYTPSTYDNRKASTEQEELMEFLQEAHFYGLKELVEAAMPRLLTIMYESNPPLLGHLRARGLLG